MNDFYWNHLAHRAITRWLRVIRGECYFGCGEEREPFSALCWRHLEEQLEECR